MNENENLTDVETEELDAETVEDEHDAENVEDADTYEYDDFESDDDSDEDDAEPFEEESDDDDDDESSADDENEDEDHEEPAPAPNVRSAREEELERELTELKKHTTRALRSLGIEEEDALEGIKHFNADAEGKSIEDYNADVDKEDKAAAERAELDNYKRRQAQIKFEAKALADLAEIQKEYPETKAYKHFSEMPNSKRYAELMASGTMSPVEAYAASHPKQVREGAANAARQGALNDTKRHIKSNVPKKGSAGEAYISKSEMRRYRELFPDMKDEEIKALHKRASN